MPPVDQALRAIAEPRRRDILRLVRDRELTSGEIAGNFPEVTGAAVSQHLRVLVEAELVTVRREGARRWYRARPQGLRGLHEYLEEFWRTSLAALAEQAQTEEQRRRHGEHPEHN